MTSLTSWFTPEATHHHPHTCQETGELRWRRGDYAATQQFGSADIAPTD
jgi:hypothetical protein